MLESARELKELITDKDFQKSQLYKNLKRIITAGKKVALTHKFDYFFWYDDISDAEIDWLLDLVYSISHKTNSSGNKIYTIHF